MSRSYFTYDEDWQRRKSLRIRSLFHDIQILSPVEEESNESNSHQEAFPSPERPYSPLPPLIIERIPITNQHDEPEEYYRKLHKKIKRIYKKLFIENRNVNRLDLDSNYNDSSINDDGEGSVDNLVTNTENNASDNSNSDIEEREERPSAASTKSNGYEADFESMDTTIIDVVNRTTSNEDVVMVSKDEETGSGNLHADRTRYDNDRTSRSGNNESTTQRMDYDKEPPFSITDNQNTTETEESIEAEIEQSSETETSVKEVMDEHEMIETIQSNTVNLVHADVSRRVESHHSVTDDQEMTESDKSNEEEKEQAEADQHSDVNGSKSKAFEMISSGEENNLIVQNDEPMEEDVETSQSSGGPYFKQITTEALIHFDGYKDSGDRESRIYEDSVKSIILPTRFRKVIASRKEEEDIIEVLAELEGNADPRTASTFDTDENETTLENLEEVTPPNLEGMDTPEDYFEAISPTQLDLTKEHASETEFANRNSTDDDKRTPTPETNEDFMRLTPKEVTIEETEPTITPRKNATKEQVRTKEPESTVKEMKTPTAATDDVEELETSHSIELMRNEEEKEQAEADQHSDVNGSKSKAFEMISSGEENNLIVQNDEPMEEDVETSQSSGGPYFKQITTEALIHFDGYKDSGDRESRIYEDSVKSIILPTRFRKVIASRKEEEDRIEVLAELEGNADPRTASTFDTDENETTLENLEEVTPPNLEGMDTPEDYFEAISPTQLDLTKEHASETEFANRNSTDDDKRTPTPETNEDFMRLTPKEVTIEETEPTITPRKNATKEQVRTKEPESTVKEMKTPTAATDDVEELETSHSIELMRTARHNLSHETIPEPATHDSESTGEHTALPQELTTLTLSTQDGGGNNMSELQTSNDMNEILTSIFNESQNKDGNTISGRKRKLVHKSVQTVKESRVSWDEMRGNFFIGTPKIFRLCACTDHVCP